ncbi:hypothetical protein ONS95_003639 [Cadophora gregata]|uniref:uncharacterized protein n=1 Tax=Cadophora gregata TaxID=51156 RepID=UPI0026DC5A3F|nr:uncharacterized protein ONS95_003639 [Cadophora gregata]KAK0106923.1 hypothetical protein ONS95_003639 [Cadophora gregata]KAK0116613.1 hypothetical protein ONS96_012469 [Cadophora gregata f. sp. sojae]
MAYLDRSEIKVPPYEALPMEELANIGLDGEARALIRYLPYLDREREISPYTQSYSYLSDVGGACRVLWDGLNDLAPWVIRLSKCPPATASHGGTIIYDMRTKSIIEWPNNEGGYTNTYLDLPTSPPEEFFNRWVGFLKNLKEIPWRNKKVCEISSEPPAPPSGFLDYLINGYVDPADGPIPRSPRQPQLGINDGLYMREARKKLYRDSGWPGAFDETDFRASRRKWQEEHDTWNRKRSVAWTASTEVKAAAFAEYFMFLAVSADMSSEN